MNSHLETQIRFLLVVKIFKIAVPLAAMICFGALAPFAESATPKRSSSSSKAKSSSSSKKSTKKSSKSSKSAKSSKSKSSKSSSAKSKVKAKSENRQAKVADESPSWIDELPEVELPEASGPPEEELLEPVAETDEP